MSKPRATKTKVREAELYAGNALTHYDKWPAPTVIVSDGPYGIGGYPGDPPTVDLLPAAYEPHLAAWSRLARPDATLWFWGTELGWATVHPLILSYGWEYRACHVWDKGIAHIAGNVNSKTIRGFPVVTEVCVQYVKVVRLPAEDGTLLPLQEWLRHEWLRSGLPLGKTNEAAGVKNAASRKYFTADHLWYFPPPETMERIAAYANRHGQKTSRPYFSLDGKTPLVAGQWAQLRSKWNHVHGVTNVWSEAPVKGEERLKEAGSIKVLHSCQKPLKLMGMCIEASSDEGDVVWEPFGGLATAMIAALRSKRRAYGAEMVPEFYALASERLKSEGT